MRTEVSDVVNSKNQVDWIRLMSEALVLKGSMGDSYNRFHNYSLGNMVLLMMQGARGPMNSYRKWPQFNRHVTRGSKAYSIMVPLTYKERLDDGTERKRVRGFKLSPCLFSVYQTEGEELPPAEPRSWSKQLALDNLKVTEARYDLLDGNTAGYSYDRTVAINPVAKYPFKTLLHELMHVQAGHTTDEGMADYKEHRGLAELEAEGGAYILVNELDMTEHADLSESRAYISMWLGRQVPPEKSFRTIFRTADQILRAGRAPAGGTNGEV